MSLVVEERVVTLERVKGCVLCTDWTGQHNRNNCNALFKGERFPNCPMSEKGILCSRKHHKLLHGTTSKYCNIVRVGKNSGPPTISEIEEEDQQGGVSTLMQVQDIPVRGRVTVRGIVLWDSAANVNLIRNDFTKKLQVEGWACVQHI